MYSIWNVDETNLIFQIDWIDIDDKQTTEMQQTIKTARNPHIHKQGRARTNKTNKILLHFNILTILLLFVLWMMDTVYTMRRSP